MHTFSLKFAAVRGASGASDFAHLRSRCGWSSCTKREPAAAVLAPIRDLWSVVRPALFKRTVLETRKRS